MRRQREPAVPPPPTGRRQAPDSLTCDMLPAVLVYAAVAALGVASVGAQHCQPIGVEAFEDPEYCDQFFLCVNGTLTHERCENGLLFDGKGDVHNHCNYNWAVDCGTRKADYTAISSPNCEYQFGIYPDGPSCSTDYVKCEYGVPYLQHCEPGLVYDHRIHKCTWPDENLELCNPEDVIGFKCPGKIPSDPVAAKYWPYPRYAAPGDCGRLITCVNGYPRLITCGENKVYDESTGTCEEPELVPRCAHFR